VSFASSLTSNLRRLPTDLEPTPGFGREAIVGHVERWFVSSVVSGVERTALLVVDVDVDDALPLAGPADASADDLELRDDGPAEARRLRLGRSVARAISAHVRPGDAVARIDAGRFAVLRGTLDDGATAHGEAGDLARGVEDALIGRPEGYGVRVTAGATTLVAVEPRDGRATLGAVTTAMLEGKLLTDDRVVVVVTPGG
jgi:hypothetical protein